jgi:hypothetical protein
MTAPAPIVEYEEIARMETRSRARTMEVALREGAARFRAAKREAAA